MSPAGRLELDSLTRRFGDVTALDDLSLTVEPGRLHGFVGANGAGKTTAMRIVVGVERPDRGRVRFGGAATDAAVRRRFGYMPEERGLYPTMGARRQLIYLARLHGLDLDAADAAARRWLDRLGLGNRMDDAVEDLSQGNQQRVQLAAALVHEPDLLILDEPFSGLDPIAADVMADVLAEQTARGVPVLFSSHQLERVERLCEVVTIISDGRVVADGPVDELRRREAPRRLRVQVDGAGPGWLPDRPGVVLVDDGPAGQLLELADDADDQALLDAARAAGRVRRFTPELPTLAELYREVTRS